MYAGSIPTPAFLLKRGVDGKQRTESNGQFAVLLFTSERTVLSRTNDPKNGQDLVRYRFHTFFILLLEVVTKLLIVGGWYWDRTSATHPQTQYWRGSPEGAVS